MSGCMAASAARRVWQAMAACRMWQAMAACWGWVPNSRCGGSCPATQQRDLRLEAVPSFLGATCSAVWSAGWGECER